MIKFKPTNTGLQAIDSEGYFRGRWCADSLNPEQLDLLGKLLELNPALADMVSWPPPDNDFREAVDPWPSPAAVCLFHAR